MHTAKLVTSAFVLFCFTVRSSRGLSKTADGCFPYFRKFSGEFSRCQNEHCFLFKSQALFINVPTTMRLEMHQRLFPCSKHSIAHPGLEGLSFDVLKETKSRNSLCAWAGDNCTFNQMVYFMAEQAQKGYRFSTLTAMLETPARRRVTRSSIALTEGEILVTSSEQMKSEPSTLKTLSMILGTFPYFSSLLLFFWCGSLAVNRACQRGSGCTSLVRIFLQCCDIRNFRGRGRGWSQFRDQTTFEEDQRAVPSYQKFRSRKFLLRPFSMIITFVLLYDVAVETFSVGQTASRPRKDLSSVPYKELSGYCLEADTAVEDVFREIVDPGMRFTRKKTPWQRCANIHRCWEKLFDQNESVKFMVSFSGEVSYFEKSYNYHSKKVTKQGNMVPYFVSMGFLHNTAVPESTLVSLDIDLLRLRTSKKLKEHLRKADGPHVEAKEPKPFIVLLFVVFTNCIFLAFFVIGILLLVCALCWITGNDSHLTGKFAERRRLAAFEQNSRFKMSQAERGISIQSMISGNRDHGFSSRIETGLLEINSKVKSTKILEDQGLCQSFFSSEAGGRTTSEAYEVYSRYLSLMLFKSEQARKMFYVLSHGPDTYFVISVLGIMIAKKCPQCSKERQGKVIWILGDGNIKFCATRLTVSRIFEEVYDLSNAQKYTLAEEDLCLARFLFHSMAITKLRGENNCYGELVKMMTVEEEAPQDSTNAFRSKPAFDADNIELFEMDLDRPIKLSLLLQISEISEDGKVFKSGNVTVPFKYDGGLIHLGEEGQLSPAAMSILSDLTDDVLVGATTSSIQRCSSKICDSTVNSRFIHSIGPKVNQFTGVRVIGKMQVRRQFESMGIPECLRDAVLLREYMSFSGNEISTTADEIAVKVAKVIREYRKPGNPIRIAQKSGGLKRLFQREYFYYVNTEGKAVLSCPKQSVIFSGSFELNVLLGKLGFQVEQTDKNEHEREVGRTSFAVRAMTGMDLESRLMSIGQCGKEEVMVDKLERPEFHLACLVVLWTLDPSVQLTGRIACVENAEWRRAPGVPKNRLCVVDTPVPQFVYTLYETEVSELTHTSDTVVDFGEVNDAEQGEEVYVYGKHH